MTTFNSITRGIRKVALKLDRLIEKNKSKADDARSQISGLHLEIDAHQSNIRGLEAEGSRAGETAEKLRGLIGEAA